jgi:actin-binding protein anillin
LLSGNAVHCWKYPEDEGKMEPTEQILLSNCITEEVALAPRDICSRINTFMLETRRQARAGDRDSLIMSLVYSTCKTRLGL